MEGDPSARSPITHRFREGSHTLTELLDANVPIRHLTGDPPGQAVRATARLANSATRSLLLLDVQMAECVYVLEGVYRQPPPRVATLLTSLASVPSVELESESAVLRALDLHARGLDFPDAYMVARAEAGSVATIVGFDRFDAKLRHLSPVVRQEP